MINAYDKLISKNKSKSLKFIAVILMVILHTFAFPDRIKEVEFISIYNINGNIPIEFYLARFGELCVGMFLFLSGYGLYIQYKDNPNIKNIFKRILKLYINYWIVGVIFIPIGVYLGIYKLNIKKLFFTITALKPNYNSEWWFITLYIMLVLLYPIIIKYINKYNKNKILIISFIINIIGLIGTKMTYIFGYSNLIVELLTILLGGEFLFLLGIIVAKYSLFDKLNSKINRSRTFYYLMTVFMIFISFVFINISIIGEIAKLILIPIFIFVLSNIINEKSILSYLGQHSTNIWLTHSFFCYYLFQDLAFMPKYPLLVLIWICILSIACSFIINYILNFINKILFSKKVTVSIKNKI